MTDPNLSMDISAEKDCLPVMERQNSKDNVFLTQHKSNLKVDKLIQAEQHRYGECNLHDSDPTLRSMDNVFPNLTIVSTGNSAAVHFGNENLLLGEKHPNIEHAETCRIVSIWKTIAEFNVSVINITGLHEAELYLGSVNNAIGQLANENEIHAFIFIVRLGQLTDADKMGLEWLQRVFGDKVLQFVMILFTYEREEECNTLKDDLKNNPVLEQLMEKCGGRYHTCNKMMNSQSEMRDLMKKIVKLFNENKQQHYTGAMFNTVLKETEAQQNPECESDDEPTVNKEGKEAATTSKTEIKQV
ncbi:interferon-induced very large GTPase 1-like protein [Labeo rohita]|uniref:Interferon-induced very large GTPase 1-like protein n=1 Tax=Labeo rohita TaxID=84645 RepID=A0A498NKB6_LABRO|nr:interferon-induced very large GTPase 1-like protein [Labeo rohita]